MMVLGRGLPFPLWAIQEQIAAALDVIVQHVQLSDGTRRITHITAVHGARDGRVVLQDVFTFKSGGVDKRGKVEGSFVLGIAEPPWMQRVRRAAPALVSGLFDREKTMRSPGPRSKSTRLSEEDIHTDISRR